VEGAGYKVHGAGCRVPPAKSVPQINYSFPSIISHVHDIDEVLEAVHNTRPSQSWI